MKIQQSEVSNCLVEIHRECDSVAHVGSFERAIFVWRFDKIFTIGGSSYIKLHITKCSLLSTQKDV